MTPDGRGGQIAAYRSGRAPNLRLGLSRKPLDGRVRTSFVQRGPARSLKLASPARARDGWIATAWARRGGPPSYGETAYMTTRSPGGRLTTTALPGPVRYVDSLAVAAAPGGAGAVGVSGAVPMMGMQAGILALEGGRPQPAVGLHLGPARVAFTSIVMSANGRDPARAVVEFGGRAFATRLQAPVR